MLLPRVGRQIAQPGLARPCLLSRSYFSPQTRNHSWIQSSTLNAGVRQRAWRASYAKRAFGAATVASIGLGLSAFTRPKVLCEDLAPSQGATPVQEQEPYGPGKPNYPPPPQSSLSLFELSFGAVAGICAGVFVKKGARAVAWLLGGMFVFLQYLGSKSLIEVDWARISSRFENLFYTRDAAGNSKPPSVLSLWRWLIDFLTADFQPRASFLAGFALGIRVG
ncbi:FUN14 domain-containing protein 1 [Leucoagaricus sp. SymC.cos]|nr:FUN14 domain-containing protein 1 [Leucoagaricus sp. SymC.cos]